MRKGDVLTTDGHGSTRMGDEGFLTEGGEANENGRDANCTNCREGANEAYTLWKGRINHGWTRINTDGDEGFLTEGGEANENGRDANCTNCREGANEAHTPWKGRINHGWTRITIKITIRIMSRDVVQIPAKSVQNYAVGLRPFVARQGGGLMAFWSCGFRKIRPAPRVAARLWL